MLGQHKSPECISVRDFTFSLFTFHFSLSLMGVSPSDRLLRKLSQVLSGRRRVSPSFACACSARTARALGDTACKNVPPAPFYCTNPAGGAKDPSQSAWIFFIWLRLMGISPSDRLLRKLSQVLSGRRRVSPSTSFTCIIISRL